MKSTFRIWACVFTLTFAVATLSAQTIKDSATETATVIAPLTPADSLQKIIDSLNATVAELERRMSDQQLALNKAQAEVDSLKTSCNCDMTYVLNYGNALLFRKYHSRLEDMVHLLVNAPDSLKEKYWSEMMEQARQMIYASNVSQDMRDRVFHLLESVPYNDALSEDIREVLLSVPDSIKVQYSLTQQAIRLIDAMPNSVTENNDSYAHVRELLSVYHSANTEVNKTLKEIQNHRGNNINIAESRVELIKKIESMEYYKKYYGQPWRIPFLNSIIDEALSRLQTAKSHVNLQDLIKETE